MSCVHETALAPLQVLQNRAIKRLFGLHYRTPSKDLYNNYKILPISLLINKQPLIFIYEILNGFKWSNTTILLNSSVHNYDINSASKVHHSAILSTKYGLRGVYNLATSAYNSLPQEIKTLKTCNNFKRDLHQYLLSSP